MNNTKKKMVALVAALLAVFATTVMGAPSASANQSFGCTSSGHTGLHATATRINYGSGSAIYISATQSWKQDYTLRTDVIYTFYRFTATGGLQTRYSNPTQWGNSSNQLDFNTEYITVTWNGKTTLGTTATPVTCTVKVGV